MSTLELTERLPACHTAPVPEPAAPSAVEVYASPYFSVKRVLDLLLAILLLGPTLPILGLLVLLVRLTSRGPGIYRQVRVGMGGRIFTMYKIRSMVCDAEAGTGATWSQTGDPRVTPLGRVLRALHLDELPQLFNVLCGEMSFVGPRPERPEFVELLAKTIPGYLNRLAVPPGITGLAQVNLPPDTDLNSVRRKLHLDLEYVQTGSLWLDLRLMAGTGLRVVKIYEPLLLTLLALRREVPESVCDPLAASSGAAVPPAVTNPAPAVQQPASLSAHSPLDWSVAAGGLTTMPKLR